MAIAHSTCMLKDTVFRTPLLKTLSRYFSHTFPDPSLVGGWRQRQKRPMVEELLILYLTSFDLLM